MFRRRGREGFLPREKPGGFLPTPPLLSQLPHQAMSVDPPPSKSWVTSRIQPPGLSWGELPEFPGRPWKARGSQRIDGKNGAAAEPRGSWQSLLPLVRHPGVNGALRVSSFLLTLPYFTADCSCGNWNEDELQAAGKVPGRPGRAAE